MYRVGLKESEVDVRKLKESGLSYVVVQPYKKIIESARQVVGRSYKRGASVQKDAPYKYDCSSLVAWAAVESGFAIPRVAIDQYVFSQRIDKENLHPGDLIFANTHEIIHTEGSFFSKVLGKEVKEEPIRTETLEYLPGTKVPEGVDHVGIYLGNNEVIHATSKKGGVVIEAIDKSDSFRNIIGYGKIILDPESRFVIEIPDDRMNLRIKENLLKEVGK